MKVLVDCDNCGGSGKIFDWSDTYKKPINCEKCNGSGKLLKRVRKPKSGMHLKSDPDHFKHSEYNLSPTKSISKVIDLFKSEILQHQNVVNCEYMVNPDMKCVDDPDGLKESINKSKDYLEQLNYCFEKLTDYKFENYFERKIK